MTDSEELRRKVERLAAAGASSDGARKLLPFGSRTLLATLLVEVDETVLARTLRVANAAGREILLDAHNRRLLRLRAPEDAQGRAGKTLWSSDDTADPESTAALRDLLEGFLDGSGSLVLKSEEDDQPPSTEVFGLSAKKLAETWGLALAPQSKQPLIETLDRVLSRHQPRILAWVRHLDGQTECGGDAALFDRVESLSRALRNEVFASSHALPDLSRDRCVFALDSYGTAGESVLLAAFDGMRVTLLVRSGDLAPVADDLQIAMHRWNEPAPALGA